MNKEEFEVASLVIKSELNRLLKELEESMNTFIETKYPEEKFLVDLKGEANIFGDYQDEKGEGSKE